MNGAKKRAAAEAHLQTATGGMSTERIVEQDLDLDAEIKRRLSSMRGENVALKHQNKYLLKTENVLEKRCSDLETRLESANATIDELEQLNEQSRSQNEELKAKLSRSSELRLRRVGRQLHAASGEDGDNNTPGVSPVSSATASFALSFADGDEDEFHLHGIGMSHGDALKWQMRATARECERNIALKKELTALNDERVELEVEVESLTRGLEDATAGRSKLMEDLAESHGKATAMSKQIDDLTRQLLETQAAAMNQEKAYLSKTVDAEKAGGELAAERALRASAESESQRLRAENAKMRLEVDAMRSEREKLRDSVTAIESAVAHERAQADANAKRNIELMERIKTLEGANRELEAALGTENENVEILETRASKASSQADTAQKALSVTLSKMEECEQKAAEAANSEREAQEIIVVLRARVEELEAELQKRTETIDALHTTIGTLRSAPSSLPLPHASSHIPPVPQTTHQAMTSPSSAERLHQKIKSLRRSASRSPRRTPLQSTEYRRSAAAASDKLQRRIEGVRTAIQDIRKSTRIGGGFATPSTIRPVVGPRSEVLPRRIRFSDMDRWYG